MAKKDNAKIVWDVFKKAGWSDEANAGALGNLDHESGFDPNITETGGFGGYGLAQWTPRENLYTQGSQLGYSRSQCETLKVQAEIITKATTVGQWTNAMSSNYDTPERQSPLTFTNYQKMTNLKNATVNFMGHYLRPTYKSVDNKIYAERYPLAQKWLKEFKGGGGGGNGGGGGDPDPEPTPPIEIPDKPKVPEVDLSSIATYFEKFVKNLIKEIEKMLIVNLYDYGQSHTEGNKFLRIDRTFKNIKKIKPTLNFKKIIDDLVELGKKEMNNLLTDITKGIKDSMDKVIDDVFDDFENAIPKPDPDPDPNPEPDDKKMYFPVNPKVQGVNFWTPPDQPNMDYGGSREGRRHWAYDIGAGGNANIKCYAVRSGEVLEVSNPLGIVVIKHSSDSNYSQYMHLNVNHFKVKKGDKVKAGEQIGVLGGTGGYAIHLHIAISINGTFATEKDTLNPRTYLKVTGNNKTSLPSPE